MFENFGQSWNTLSQNSIVLNNCIYRCDTSWNFRNKNWNITTMFKHVSRPPRYLWWKIIKGQKEFLLEWLVLAVGCFENILLIGVRDMDLVNIFKTSDIQNLSLLKIWDQISIFSIFLSFGFYFDHKTLRGLET